MARAVVLLPISNQLVEAIAELMPVGEGAAPIAVRGWPARYGLWKKIVVDYPNGWAVRINFDRHGCISSTSASIRLVSQIKGKAGHVIIDEAATMAGEVA